MNKHQLFTLLSLLLVTGSGCADSVSSSITCTGASWVSSSVSGPTTSLTQSIFTTDPAVLLREISSGSVPRVKTVATSTGPMGIDEYSSHLLGKTTNPGACLFELPENRSIFEQTRQVLGLFQKGMYSSDRSVDADDLTRFLLEANGTGLLLTRSRSTDSNQTLIHASDVAGELQVSEIMQAGEANEY